MTKIDIIKSRLKLYTYYSKIFNGGIYRNNKKAGSREPAFCFASNLHIRFFKNPIAFLILR